MKNKIKNYNHNCGLIAVKRILPYLSEDDIIKFFQLCCKTWPYGGVTNKELNVIINNLKIKKLLKYYHQETVIKNLMNNKTYINTFNFCFRINSLQFIF